MSGRGVGNYDTRGTSRASQAVHRDRMMERLEDALDALDEARKELGLSEERVLALLAIEYLTAHPELLAEQLVKHVIEWATQKTDNWNRPSDGRVAVREAAREAAARLLEKDENFRARVLDMAGLSDSDRIEVKIELKPAGGNAR